MPFLEKEFSDDWAYDLDKNFKSKGELKNEDVITQSIELIIGTILGERLFNPRFGSRVFETLFEGLTETTGEEVLDSAIEAIKEYEDRVIVNENNSELLIFPDNNSVIISIPYRIKRSGKESVFKKKIIN